MKEDNERVDALNAIFDDDPMQKEREKEIRRLEKKREKQLAKLQKKGIDPEQQRSEEAVKEADADEKEASDKVLNEDGEAITNYFAESDPASNTHVQDEVDKPKKKKKKEKKKQEKEEINIVKDLISLAKIGRAHV